MRFYRTKAVASFEMEDKTLFISISPAMAGLEKGDKPRYDYEAKITVALQNEEILELAACLINPPPKTQNEAGKDLPIFEKNHTTEKSQKWIRLNWLDGNLYFSIDQIAPSHQRVGIPLSRQVAQGLGYIILERAQALLLPKPRENLTITPVEEKEEEI